MIDVVVVVVVFYRIIIIQGVDYSGQFREFSIVVRSDDGSRLTDRRVDGKVDRGV